MKRGGPLERRTPLKRTAMSRSRKPLPRASRRELKVSRPAKRRAVKVLLARSGGRCEMGGFSERCTGVGVVPHHVVKQSATDEHDPAVMRWSCWWCNEEVERDPARAEREGLFIQHHMPAKTWGRQPSHVKVLAR